MATYIIDNEPQQDADGRWFISICDERQDIAYAYFDTEEEGLDFCEAIEALLAAQRVCANA